jgi:hypothetical protein
LLDTGANDLHVALVIEGGCFTGAAAGYDAVGAVLDLELDKLPKCLFVKASLTVEGGDDGHNRSSEHDWFLQYLLIV